MWLLRISSNALNRSVFLNSWINSCTENMCNMDLLCCLLKYQKLSYFWSLIYVLILILNLLNLFDPFLFLRPFLQKTQDIFLLLLTQVFSVLYFVIYFYSLFSFTSYSYVKGILLPLFAFSFFLVIFPFFVLLVYILIHKD